jgi:tRNA(fMet)-specific endonuclease VapC
MILLDTDHLTILQMEASDRRNNLVARLALSADTRFAAPVVSVEEQMKGWMASIARERKLHRQVSPYRELADLFRFYSKFEIALFDEAAADQCLQFSRIKISMSDRKIAAIAIVHSALLLTANRRDFEQIPGLRFENWMD